MGCGGGQSCRKISIVWYPDFQLKNIRITILPQNPHLTSARRNGSTCLRLGGSPLDVFSVGCLEFVWRVSGLCLKGIYGLSKLCEGCLDVS